MSAFVLVVCALLVIALLVRVAYAYGVMNGARAMARVVISVDPDHGRSRSYGATTAGRTDAGTGTTAHRDERGAAVPAQERRSPGTNHKT